MALAKDDRVRTIGEGGRRVWLYPLRVVGRFVKARTAVAWALFALLLIAPWIDVAGHPAMLFDIPGRRFYFWGLTFFPTDAWWLLFGVGIFIFSIFFFTAVFGRLWCGWACPQTVLMESIIRPIEELIEGPPSARKRLDQAPWSAGKVARKGLKLTAFLIVAGAFSTTLVAYFIGRDGVLMAQAFPSTHPAGTSFFVVLTGILFFDFAWFREQTCVVVCPYGRFQSVLLDPDSLAIAYDAGRGEPRGKAKAEGTGDCVDCRKCVVVCPTGIDIRDGIQMECINCTACIDACDSIMDKLGRPRGLIRYTSERILAGQPRRILRPRVVLYGVALVLLVVGFSTAVALRAPVEVNLARLPGAPYVQLPDGRIQNMMQLRISNRAGAVRHFKVALEGPEGTDVSSPVADMAVAPGAVQHFPVLVVRPADGVRETRFRLRVVDDAGVDLGVTGTFLAPLTEGG
ncbi:MAG: cytochrome c oxidase accessory protein CcoG [Myxococcales bacterium]|nr:cytochrome c oxidase accessory protein CcoG [Myxococcales bacterium]